MTQSKPAPSLRNKLTNHFVLCLTLLPVLAFAQPSADSPAATDPSTTESPMPAQPIQPFPEAGRIMGMIPDHKIVSESEAAPLTTHEKFKLAFSDTTDPFTAVLAGFNAGVSHWQNDFPSFGQGARGYARRFGAAYADQAIGNYLAEAVFPTMFHEDPRYFRKATGTTRQRMRYAVTRVLITRSDTGRDAFNYSEILGNATAAGISNLYYPAATRSFASTGEKFAVQVISDAAFNVLLEFWPDMRHKIFHK